ncbi:hydrolase [Lactobacillus taiwanensis]|uniref:Cof-type HAD-IIB family hydrolase n=1 Tax=Lactobacillus taiwanensis TaxID=508451 RepID=UPI000B9822A3|nr:Cof-type HAD-IIB family hydrolase [Lactobacillus taiwanensis]OYS20922.1 hydrolase [Lactobacillus taiwanensis]OYS24976.1 hydrolase [Lactobacillus taiwanensis]OYS26452.1 hydrolase [Lactobacillus taiwanensis]OYS26745.1 hydrolase [Lactobacillus taiwanensis]OYS29860.1 hydrolase [Lactobacillus taiwanensis]
MIKTIFFDVDGTLVSHKTDSVPASTKRTLELLRENGVKLVLATGRDMSQLKKLPVRDIKFDGYVTMNGQLCLDENGKELFGNPIDEVDTEKMIELIKEKRVPITTIGKEGPYINFVTDQVVAAQKAVSSKVVPIGKYHGEEVYQFIAYGDRNELKTLVDELPNCKLSWWNEYAVDIISKNGGKLAGIKKYLELQNQTLDDAMAFGDGENDLEMLKAVKVGVAMGNGEEHVKQIADYVTTDINKDGIYNASMHYKLI